MGGDMLNAMKYISTVPFSGLFNWDVKIILGDNIITSKKHPMKPFSYFTRPANIQKVKIEDEQEYKILGVRSYGLGAYKNRITKGKYLKMKVYQQAKLNHLFWCKVDTKNGAFGIITQELSDGIASSNMMFAELDLSRINPDYLQLLFRCPKINAYMDSMVTGTTNRKYIRFSDLLSNVKVPVPSLEEQNKLVKAYNDIMLFIKMEERKAIDIDVKATVSVRNALGVAPYPGHVEKKLVHYIDYGAIDSWSVPLILHAENSPFGKSKFACKKLSDLAFINPKTDLSMLSDTDNMSFIPMEDISDDYGEWTGKRVGSKSNVKGYTKFQDGDIIWARITPCMQNGKSTILTNLVNGKGYGSTEFHVIRIKSNDVLPQYIHTLLRHFDVLSDAKKYFTGSAGQQRVPTSYLENLLIPVPPLEVQKQIADEYANGIEQAKQGYIKIYNYKQKLKKNFETQIFE